MDLNLNSINNYIDVNEANSTNIGIVPDSTLDVGSFDSEAIRYWNESLQQLYEKYKELVSKDDIVDGKFGINMTIRDGGDSGYHFSEGEPYVIPDKNADNKTYEEVRGDDKIDAVLQNQDNLQFTREKPSEKKSYVRLIMPKYSRRVEVEDLDRNFWVIGQALDQICDFLFNDQSPLNLILKNILNELLGIWQNIYLLWGKVNVVEDETLNWLRNSGVSNLFGSAVKSYLTKDICSPKFWFDTNGNNLWEESVKEFSFLQSSPYDSIYVYDSNQKELNVGHKYWKDFTIGELSNSKTISTFAVLLEFFKDTISSYNSDKAFVRFSVVREYEADNTSSEINSIVSNPGGDVNAEGR